MKKFKTFVKFIWHRYIIGSEIKYTWKVKQFSFYGDSTAYMMGDRMAKWHGENLVSNFAVNGSVLDLWLRYKDYIKRDNIIILAGGNNLNSGYSVNHTVYLYTELLNRIVATNPKGKIYCVGLAPMSDSRVKQSFKLFNERIEKYIRMLDHNSKKIFYISTDDIYSPGDLPDGLHHSDDYDRKILAKIVLAKQLFDK